MTSEYALEMVNGWAAAFNVPLKFNDTPNPQIIIVANWLCENFNNTETMKNVFNAVLENFLPTATVPFPTISNIRQIWADYNVITMPDYYDPHKDVYGNVDPKLSLDNPEIKEQNESYFHAGAEAEFDEMYRENLLHNADFMFKKYGYQKYLKFYMSCTIEQLDEIDRINPAKYKKGA